MEEKSMVRAKLEENGVEIEFKGSTPGVKAEMAFLLKYYRKSLEDKYGKEKAENIYEETFDLSNCSEKEIRENFNRDFIRELREMLGAKND